MPTKPPNHPHVLKNGRPTIAVLVGSMTSEYQEGIMRGAAYVAAKKDYNIIGFCGGALNTVDPLSLSRDKVFDLVDMDLIAGVISPFSSHMRFLDEQASQQFIEKFSSAPIVNIGSHIDAHSNVMTDYETAFNELFEHLYHTHGYRRILLVRGPKNHASSEKRMQLYKQQLFKYGLPFDEEMVIYTNLNRTSIKATINTFLDTVTTPFDAIITINDNQALGIIDACQARSIRVPEDVAIVGSMNTLEGAFSTPALTSIQEPLFELGSTAARELINQIEGKQPLPEIKIPTSLMLRKSCGCSSLAVDKPSQHANKFSNSPLSMQDDPIFNDTKRYFEQITGQYKGGIMRYEVTTLLTLYQQAIYTKEFTAFLTALQKILEDRLASGDIVLWLALTAKIQMSTLHYLEMNNDTDALLSFLAQLMTLKNKTDQLAIKFQQFETEYYLNHFRAIVKNLNSSFDLSSIQKYCADILQTSELYISLFDKTQSDMATNLVSVRSDKCINVQQKTFLANKLLPNGIETYHDRFTLMVFPLSFRESSIGFMTLNLSDRKGAAFENLRAIISSALKNDLLIQDLKTAEQRFSDIAHSTSNWLWETDINNCFTYCSDSANDIIGYSPEGLLGQKIDNLNRSNEYIQRMKLQQDFTDIECWYQHQNGQSVCLLISAKAINNEGIFKGYRGIFEDITEKKIQENKIKNLAYSDLLTGLPNRTRFQDQLTETIAFSAANDKKFALMFIDLDHFKHINDSMGHDAGDLLLKKLAKCLNKSTRTRDIVARLGGDEFVIILPDISHESDVIDIAQRIFSEIQKPILIQEKPIYSTLSAGISLYPNDGLDAASLLQKGDNAMYQAKSQGRNGYVFYDKLFEKKNALRIMYAGILREAIATDGFVLHYQPQVSARTGNIIGFEALVRINNNKLGIITPNHFIPLAEELGLIAQVDQWVFEACCKQHQTWRHLGLNNKRLSINLSARQLRDDAVLNTYIEILERYSVNPSDIQLEITENALVENEHVALKILQGFKRHGVSIALDDFGTGYSSLNCINLYPIDTIKIDRSFIRDAVDNPRNKAIIQGIVLIANTLQLNIIAEGVETFEQYTFIKQLGCNEIQGFYFYNPCTVAETQALLENRLFSRKHKKRLETV